MTENLTINSCLYILDKIQSKHDEIGTLLEDVDLLNSIDDENSFYAKEIVKSKRNKVTELINEIDELENMINSSEPRSEELFNAIYSNDLDIVSELLMSGVNPYTINEDGYTILMSAIDNCNLDMILLITKFFNYKKYHHYSASSPLKIINALLRGEKENVELFSIKDILEIMSFE